MSKKDFWDGYVPEPVKQQALDKMAENERELGIQMQPAQDDPCPGCRKGAVCRTPKCGRLKLPVDHPYRSEQPAQQEPVALKWQQAPVKTQWGDDMVVASVAIDNDHTLSLYCERDQTAKVDAMLAQRTWVSLTDEQIDRLWSQSLADTEGETYLPLREFARAIEAKLKEKNNG